MLSVPSPFVSFDNNALIDPPDQTIISFDDILDIARELEFAQTITYITEIDELSTGSPFSLEHLFATILSTEKPEDHPIPTSISQLALAHDHDRVRDGEWRMSMQTGLDMTVSSSPQTLESSGPQPYAHVLPMCEANADLPPKDDNDHARIKVEDPFPAKLQGWSPPDGSSFLELEDNLSHPNVLQDKLYPPWLAKILTPSSNVQPYPTSSTTRPGNNDDQEPGKPVVRPQAPSTSQIGKEVEHNRFKVLPSAPPKEPSPESSNRPESFTAPEAKPLKVRLHPLSISTPAPRKHAGAPRGGIPPHIARTVTKANILRAEKERKLAKIVSSSSSSGEGKKPSVLIKVSRKDGDTVAKKAMNSGGSTSRKKLFTLEDDAEREEGRAVKRARV